METGVDQVVEEQLVDEAKFQRRQGFFGKRCPSSGHETRIPAHTLATLFLILERHREMVEMVVPFDLGGGVWKTRQWLHPLVKDVWKLSNTRIDELLCIVFPAA